MTNFKARGAARLALPFLLLAAPAFAQDSAVNSIVTEWSRSAHADAQAEAFTHWNDEGEIPAQCAFCHSGAGFRDYHGIDGTAAGSVDAPQPVGGVIDCDTCHAPGVSDIAEVTFPSGVSVSVSDNNATCFTCHQGRQSGPGLEERVAGLDADTVDPDLSFVNPHYKAAAASLLGNVTAGMYQYEGQSYAGRFAHVENFDSCSGCHSPHSLEIAVAECNECHKTDDIRAIRTGQADIDGDGDTAEGVHGEIATLMNILGQAIIAYARDTVGEPIAYAPGSYPYFFHDTDADGAADPEESVYPNRYASWTPRLLKAAYNYQFAAKDPGAYAHNPDYTAQILIDSIADIDSGRADAFARP